MVLFCKNIGSGSVALFVSWAVAREVKLMGENPTKGQHTETFNNKKDTRNMEGEEKEERGERETSPTDMMHRSNSRPLLDVSRAAIQANSEDRNPIILLPNQSDDICHLALDIGGLKISNSFFF